MSWKAGEEIMYRGCRFCPVFKNEQLALIKLYEFESKLAEAKSIIEAALKAQRNLPLPQDMKTRLTFEFGDFEKLRAALSLCVPIECETGVEGFKKEIEQFPTVDDISIDYRDTNLELIEKLLASINKKRSSNDSTSTNHSKPTNNTIKV